MTRSALLFSLLAVSLAVVSISMTPATGIESPRAEISPAHVLTGVTFHAVSVAF